MMSEGWLNTCSYQPTSSFPLNSKFEAVSLSATAGLSFSGLISAATCLGVSPVIVVATAAGSAAPACPRMAVEVVVGYAVILNFFYFFSHLFASSLKSSSSDGSQSSSLHHFLQIQQLFLIFASQSALTSV